MSGVFQLDGELFPRDPVQKQWSRVQVGRQGNNLPIYTAFWQLELGFAILDTATDVNFFETKFQAGGAHTLTAPHPETGILTLFTGVAVRNFTHTFNEFNKNTWNDDSRLTLARIVVE